MDLPHRRIRRNADHPAHRELPGGKGGHCESGAEFADGVRNRGWWMVDGGWTFIRDSHLGSINYQPSTIHDSNKFIQQLNIRLNSFLDLININILIRRVTPGGIAGTHFERREGHQRLV